MKKKTLSDGTTIGTCMILIPDELDHVADSLNQVIFEWMDITSDSDFIIQEVNKYLDQNLPSYKFGWLEGNLVFSKKTLN